MGVHRQALAWSCWSHRNNNCNFKCVRVFYVLHNHHFKGIAPASVFGHPMHTGVCEININLDGAGDVNVPKWARTPMCQHARAALIKTILVHPIPLNWVPIGQTTFKPKLAMDFGHAERWHVWPRPANPLAPEGPGPEHPNPPKSGRQEPTRKANRMPKG